MSFEQTELDRRLASIAQTGRISKVRYGDAPMAKVKIGDWETGWLLIGTRRAGDAHDSWAYSVGEDVLVISTSGDFAQGVIVCAISNASNPSKASEKSHHTAYPDGVVIEVKDGAVHITAPKGVIVNGDVIADGVSLKTHVHKEVQRGIHETGGPQ